MRRGRLSTRRLRLPVPRWSRPRPLPPVFPRSRLNADDRASKRPCLPPPQTARVANHRLPVALEAEGFVTVLATLRDFSLVLVAPLSPAKIKHGVQMGHDTHKDIHHHTPRLGENKERIHTPTHAHAHIHARTRIHTQTLAHTRTHETYSITRARNIYTPAHANVTPVHVGTPVLPVW